MEANTKVVDAKIPDADIEAGVKANVEKILAAQGAEKKWGTKEHNRLIYLIAKDCGMEKEDAQNFIQFLPFCGLGGNASQFRQSKMLKDKVKSEKDIVKDYLAEVD